jgi:hypothetical protein
MPSLWCNIALTQAASRRRMKKGDRRRKIPVLPLLKTNLKYPKDFHKISLKTTRVKVRGAFTG